MALKEGTLCVFLQQPRFQIPPVAELWISAPTSSQHRGMDRKGAERAKLCHIHHFGKSEQSNLSGRLMIH